MGKGPMFRDGNAARHDARNATPLWYEECAEVDVRVLRIQLAMGDGGEMTYEARMLLRELRGEVQRGKEMRTRRIEERSEYLFS